MTCYDMWVNDPDAFISSFCKSCLQKWRVIWECREAKKPSPILLPVCERDNREYIDPLTGKPIPRLTKNNDLQLA